MSAPDVSSDEPARYQNLEIVKLRLFITGLTPNSRKAVENIKAICEKYLHGRYGLEIIDVYQQPELASGYQLIAMPMLVMDYPLPARKMVGDMSDTEKVLTVLNLI